MKVYVMEQLKEEVILFKEKELDISPEEVIRKRIYTSDFTVADREKGFIRIQNPFFEKLFRALGFGEEASKISNILFLNEDSMLRYVAETNLDLLPLIKKFIQSPDWLRFILTRFPEELLPEEGKLEILWKIHKLKFGDSLIVPPIATINTEAIKEADESEEDSIPRPGIDPQLIKALQRFYKSLKRKINQLEDKSNGNNLFNGTQTILTFDMFHTNPMLAVGEIEETKRRFNFILSLAAAPTTAYTSGLTREKLNDLKLPDFLIYEDGSFTYSEEYPERSYKEIVVFTYHPMIYSLFEAEYEIIPSEDKPQEWPHSPYLPFPWFVPIKKGNVKTIKSKEPPQWLTREIYYPGKNFPGHLKELKEPILLAKLNLGER